MSSELADALLAALPLPDDPEYAVRPGLEGLLEDWVRTARVSWPSVDMSPSSFMAYAMDVAFAELTPDDDESVLMQHDVDGLTTGQLGRLRGLHRVSISRHLDSVLRALESHLDITLERVLAPSSKTRPGPGSGVADA